MKALFLLTWRVCWMMHHVFRIFFVLLFSVQCISQGQRKQKKIPVSQFIPRDGIRFDSHDIQIDQMEMTHKYYFDPVKLPFTAEDYETAKELGMKISDAEVINNKGLGFKPFPYKNNLHFEIASRTHDPEKASRILNALNKYLINPDIKITQKNYILEWLVKRSIFLGADKNYYIDDLKEELLSKKLLEEADWPLIHSSLDQIFSDIENGEKGNFVKNKNSKKIVILTTTSGGGHYSAALALKDFLSKGLYEPELVIVDEFSDTADPLKVISGIYDGGDIFNEFAQKAGDYKKAIRYWGFAHHLTNFFPNKTVTKVKDKIKEINPFYILNTCVYTDIFASLSSSLDIPQLLVTTDYDIWHYMDNIVQNGNPSLLKVALTSDKKIIFERFFNRYSENVRSQLINPSTSKIEPLYESYLDPEKNFQNELRNISVLYPFGYPVRQEIEKFNVIKLKQVFEEKGFIKDPNILSIAMGSQGKPSIFEIINEVLISDKLDHLDVIYILCGKNQDLKSRIEDILKKSSSAIAKKIVLLGFQTPKDMAELYNITDHMVSKPGGSTTAEVLIVGNKMIMYDLNPGEELNANYLTEAGLGFYAKKSDEIIDQYEVSNASENHLSSDYVPLNWKENLLNLLNLQKSM
jgi:UDP-N-acetylglucosamine:LPS N-acetylglucosamine transferase